MQPALEANWAYVKPRHEIIATTPALHERELAKLDALADALATALQARRVADLRAVLAARTGMAAFVAATFAWLDDPTVAFGERIEFAKGELKALVAESA